MIYWVEHTSHPELSERHPELPGLPKTQNNSLGANTAESTWTSQLPFKEPQVPSNRDHKALNSGTVGGVGIGHSLEYFGGRGRHRLDHALTSLKCPGALL